MESKIEENLVKAAAYAEAKTRLSHPRQAQQSLQSKHGLNNVKQSMKTAW